MKPRNNKATQFLVLQEVTNIRLRALVKCLFGADIIYLFIYLFIYSMQATLFSFAIIKNLDG